MATPFSLGQAGCAQTVLACCLVVSTAGCDDGPTGSAPDGSTSPYSGQTPVDVVPSLTGEIRGDDPMADALRKAQEAMTVVGRANQKVRSAKGSGSGSAAASVSSQAPTQPAPDASAGVPRP